MGSLFRGRAWLLCVWIIHQYISFYCNFSKLPQKIMPIVQQNKGLETAVSKEIPDFYLDKLNF